VPWVRHIEGQLAAIAGPDAAWLHTSVPIHGRDRASFSEFTVRAGERVSFVLTWQPSHRQHARVIDPLKALADTEAFWREWIADCTYRGEWEQSVRRSLITLKALTYAPTGGIVAAATTSLPEQLGGPRNWDYRYCWLRDAAFTLQSLLNNGYEEEARAWREWLLRAVAGDPAELQIMYSIKGGRRLQEWDVPWLRGYEGSRPVRVGNAASTQLQLDVWGEVLDCLHVSRETGLARDDSAWGLQRALMDFLEGNWRQPDNGLWEMRGPRRDFVHSKVLAWVAADRMVHAVERSGLRGDVDRWRAMRADIHAEVCGRGFDARRNTFTQYYGSDGLDAALLLIPRLGFLPPDDPRVRGTVAAIERELCEDGFILRYRPEVGALDGGVGVDGLPGGEGAFLACTFWFADAKYLIGRHDEAREMFERLLDLRNDVGLLSEEYDATLKRHVGNTPQAFSHVSLVNTAGLLNRAPGELSVRKRDATRCASTRTVGGATAAGERPPGSRAAADPDDG
jgi:GH15 family glucan-1,4-alpha-glucosidase